MSEAKQALLLADKVLERPSADPDDDLAVLARQLVRTREKLEALWHFSGCPYDHCEKCIRDAPIIKALHEFLGSPTQTCEPEEPDDRSLWTYDRLRAARGEA